MASKPQTDSLPAHPAPSDSHSVAQTTLRTALFLGFGAILALSVGVGVLADVGFERIEREIDRGTQAFIETERDLAVVRDGVLEAAVYVRDLLLSAEPDRAAFYRSQIQQSRAMSQAAFVRIHARVSHVGSEDVEEFEREVTEYWSAIDPVLALAPIDASADPLRLIRERLVPRRELILQIARQLQHTSQIRFQEQQRDVTGLRANLQRRIWLIGILSLVLCLAVAAIVTVYSGRLERRLREQLARNTQYAEDLHRLSAQLVGAQEAERRLISRELHDEIGQALTAVKMHLGAVLRTAAPERRGEIEQARLIADNALQSVRQLARLLRPPMLDDMGLAETVRWYLDGFSERTGIETEFDCQDEVGPLAADEELCLYRIVQEATTNVARHAEARSCRVSLDRLSDTVVLRVEDDGKGIASKPADREIGNGVGLLGIRERVAAFHGEFALDSSSGGGTRLRVELPYLAGRTADEIGGESQPDAEADEPSSTGSLDAEHSAR